MDYIFECFYTDTLDQITRNGLQDRSSRRNVLDHLNAIIGGCSDGQNMRTEEVARIAVKSAIRYHRDHKDSNGDVCLMGKYHNILYIALRTCWDWGVRDSAVVVVLLEEIYACEKTFERIFLGALFGPNAPHFIAGWRSDFRDQDENTRAMVYFLNHATSLNMTLPVWISRYEQERMVKFIDIPIESCGNSSPLRVALQASAPDLLLILLRYGANPHPQDGGSSIILALLDKLIEDERNYVQQHISCLKMLLRNITLIELPYKPIIYATRREMFFTRYGNLLIDKILPKEQVYGVMSLRHLCRCRIRDLLRSNGQLPDGIDTLRLPRRLQRYIDLMEEIEGPESKSENKKNNDNENPTNSKGKTKRKVSFLDNIKEDEEATTSTTTSSARLVYKERATSRRLPYLQSVSFSEDDDEDEDDDDDDDDDDDENVKKKSDSTTKSEVIVEKNKVDDEVAAASSIPQTEPPTTSSEYSDEQKKVDNDAATPLSLTAPSQTEPHTTSSENSDEQKKVDNDAATSLSLSAPSETEQPPASTEIIDNVVPSTTTIAVSTTTSPSVSPTKQTVFIEKPFAF